MWTSAFNEKKTQRTKHVLHMFCERMVINTFGTWHASRSRMDGRYQPEPAACSRTLPMASDAVACLGLSSQGTRKFGIRAVESFLPFSKLPRKWVQHERSAPVGTLHHRLVSNAQTNLRASGPNVLPRLAVSGVFGYHVFLILGLSFSVYFLLCVCTCSSRFVFFAARVSVSVFVFLFVRAPLYLNVFLGVF